ncbi:DUF5681 domain-containing protein [Sphingorhabdus sp. EL138]|uniref:DUF5681 domain-containing protein n=1 Tax=Sphingorhabdus sp. EL138 TaxID=2073156 RepID=UPI000D6933A1|nr:DUF5681 domain-containing protein [Sphingorhabdus sp. EL138]
MTDKDSDQSSAGYGKPPKDRQFAPGNSGNPRGRPKGANNKATILREIADEEHRVTIGGETKQVKTIDLLFMRLRELAMKGDEKALDAYTDWLDRFELESQSTWSCGLLLGEGFYGPGDTTLTVEQVDGTTST